MNMIDEKIMKTIQNFIENELEKQVRNDFNIKNLDHNHPPLRFTVDDCEYCKKYGNIFEIH